MGLFARARVTLPAKVGSTFPKPSSALTTRPKPLPAVTLAGGWVVTTSCVAVAAVTVMAPVVAALRPAAGRLQRGAGPGLVQRQAGEGRHAGAGRRRSSVPPRVAPLGLFARARVTLP